MSRRPDKPDCRQAGGNDRTLVIPYVVIPACPESLLFATHH